LKLSSQYKSKSNWSEVIYADGEWFLFVASQIRWMRFFRETRVSINDVFSSATFSGLRNTSTFVGNCRADRNHGAAYAEPALARSTDG